MYTWYLEQVLVLQSTVEPLLTHITRFRLVLYLTIETKARLYSFFYVTLRYGTYTVNVLYTYPDLKLHKMHGCFYCFKVSTQF